MSNPRAARFGYTVFNLPLEEQIELAVAADELGYDAAWFGEHIVTSGSEASIYMPNAAKDPTKSSGVPRSIYDQDTKLYDLVALMAAAARQTRRIAIISGVYLAPLRHPLMTARTVATLHDLSHGRFQLGLGSGWNKNEFAALGASFEDRGTLLDETVDVLRLAMRGGSFEYSGRLTSFGPVIVEKSPFAVPILFGGHSEPALERAARIGDGWVSSISNEVDELLRIRDRIDALRDGMGTADRPFDHWIKVNSTEPDEVARLQRLGVNCFVFYGDGLWGPGKVELADRIRRLRKVSSALGLQDRRP